MSDENPVPQHASVSQVEQEYLGCKRNQSQSNPVGLCCLMLRRLIVCVQSVPVLLGRFLPQLLAVICMHSGRWFVLQRRIWPKYNIKGDAHPSVSLRRSHLCREGSFYLRLLVVQRSACCFPALFFLKDFTVFLWPVLYSGVCLCLYQHRTGVGTEMLCSRTTPACEMAEQEITGSLQSTPFSLGY